MKFHLFQALYRKRGFLTSFHLAHDRFFLAAHLAVNFTGFPLPHRNWIWRCCVLRALWHEAIWGDPGIVKFIDSWYEQCKKKTGSLRYTPLKTKMFPKEWDYFSRECIFQPMIFFFKRFFNHQYFEWEQFVLGARALPAWDLPKKTHALTNFCGLAKMMMMPSVQLLPQASLPDSRLSWCSLHVRNHNYTHVWSDLLLAAQASRCTHGSAEDHILHDINMNQCPLHHDSYRFLLAFH